MQKSNVRANQSVSVLYLCKYSRMPPSNTFLMLLISKPIKPLTGTVKHLDLTTLT